jgi:hypothetical protein
LYRAFCFAVGLVWLANLPRCFRAGFGRKDLGEEESEAQIENGAAQAESRRLAGCGD